MINEERVRELYQMAVYDETEDKKCHPMGEYYIWDYVGKESNGPECPHSI